MDKHTWSDYRREYTTSGTMLSARAPGGVGPEEPEFALRADDAEPVLCREILRLAQREADLTAEVAVVEHGRLVAVQAAHERATQRDALAARTKELESLVAEQAERIRELEGLLAMNAAQHSDTLRDLQERDHQLGLAKEAVTLLEDRERRLTKDNDDVRQNLRAAHVTIERQRVRLVDLKAKLAAEESKGRQYCCELAEKASALVAHRRVAIKCLSAIGAALGHVEEAKARAGAPLCQRDEQVLEALDLAHEALAGAGKLEDHPAEQADSEKEARRVLRLADIEEILRRGPEAVLGEPDEVILPPLEATLVRLAEELSKHGERIGRLEKGIPCEAEGHSSRRRDQIDALRETLGYFEKEEATGGRLGYFGSGWAGQRLREILGALEAGKG